jgi:hypothetical protein
MKMMLLMGLAELSLLSVQPLAIIHYAAHGRVACWRDFHEVQTGIAGSIYRVMYIDNSDLIV